ncbi:MAG: hypothetical protein H0W39_12140 [Sphingomonas sp.]|nr:hypothetical protein [Sphingomonas sp.]
MNSLLLRAMPLAMCLALGQPGVSQVTPAPLPAQQPAHLSAEQWREDLAFMAAEMKRRHANLHHSVSSQEFEAAVADLHARIPVMQRNEIVVGLMSLAAMIGDGHTRVDPRKDPKFGFPSLPLKLYLFEDGLFVRAARPDYATLVGAEVVEIGGVPVAEAIRRTQAISSIDNVIGYKKFAPIYLNMPDILHALKLSGSRDSAVLKLRQAGQTRTVTVPAGQIDPLWPPDTDVSLVTPEGWTDARAAPQPLWLQAPLDYHRLIALPGQKALYAQINMITGIDGQSLTQFGEKIRRQAEAMNPRAVIFDVRLAHGGNHDLRFGLIRELIKAEDDDTQLFVLTGRGAYSATEALLVDFDRLTKATLVGEPASSKPNSYGDSYRTPLPNSGISVRTSIQFNQLRGQSRDPWTWVDVATPYTFADYASGRDPALSAALAFEPEATLTDRLKKVASPADARRLVEEYAADPRKRFADQERQMLIAAETVGAGKHSEIALAVAEVAAARFPRSHDAQLVFAFLLERAGRTAAAVEAARRALAIDPDSRQGRSLLERVQKQAAPISP